MSETKYHKGILIPIKKEDFNENIEENIIKIDNIHYLIKSEELDPYDNFYNARKNNNGTIDFEVRFHNGGCCLHEAIEEAVKNIKNNNKNRIIAGFPGVGKSYYCNNSDLIISDSDSSSFSKDSSFPENYFFHINNILLTNKYDFIFISTHYKVLEYLVNNYEKFIIVIPSLDRKEEMLEIYKKRNNTPEFIELLRNNYDNWIKDIIDKYFKYTYILPKNTFLKDRFC